MCKEFQSYAVRSRLAASALDWFDLALSLPTDEWRYCLNCSDMIRAAAVRAPESLRDVLIEREVAFPDLIVRVLASSALNHGPIIFSPAIPLSDCLRELVPLLPECQATTKLVLQVICHSRPQAIREALRSIGH